eukprot:jgi/Botrbrau1/1546/Bobra.0107s0034.1
MSDCNLHSLRLSQPPVPECQAYADMHCFHMYAQLHAARNFKLMQALWACAHRYV